MSASLAGWAALLLGVLAGCGGDGATHVPGTTLRVDAPTPLAEENHPDFQLQIFTEEQDCAGLEGADATRCLPWVNRATAEVHLAFRPMVSSEPYYLPLTRDHIQVLHEGREIRPQAQEGGQIELIPHDPRPAPQLFILVIDGSSSMTELDGGRVQRIERVRRALLDDAVVDRFFPEGRDREASGVVLLQFTQEVVPVGGELKVLHSKKAYKDLVRGELGVVGGYTHLYDAVEYATGALLDEPALAPALADAQPVVIALTDGFNNEAADDTCKSNLPRLQSLLEHLDEARAGKLRQIPTVHAVGLGNPLGKKDTAKADQLQVSGKTLCGNRLNERIDNGLENLGIDRVSLDWIAAHGGGGAVVGRNAKKLSEAFQGIAAQRYGWFELRYRVNDNFWLRRAFTTTLRLKAFVPGGAEVRLRPSAWLDAPTGAAVPDSVWSEPRPFRVSAVTVIPLLALMIVLGFVSASLFNVRRSLLGRKAPPPGDEGQTRV